MREHNTTLILGGGYVGRRLAERLGAPATQRSEAKTAARRALYFDLADRDSWHAMPQSDPVIWTFPAVPLRNVKAFYQAKLKDVATLFVFASTSGYLTQHPEQWIDENHPLDFSRERVAGEEWLREQGATILVLAGIYGPDRQPRDWLKKGLIKTPDKRVNLIHVDDIVTITERLLNGARNPRGERFNLADGEALYWREIAQHYRIAIQAKDQDCDNKRVSHDKICRWLGGYRFRSLLGDSGTARERQNDECPERGSNTVK